MDYRKIGQGLQPRVLEQVRTSGMPLLQVRPLEELGLTGLVERLALAIRENERRGQ